MTDLANLGIEFQSRGASDVNAQLDAYSAKAGKAADAADKLNATAGKSGAGFNDMAKGIASANKAVTESDRTVANMGASLNAAMTRNTAMFDSMRRGVSSVHADITKGADAVVKSAGLARYELINLSRQAQDVAVSLGSGQSFGTVLLQQGTQIADVFANSEGSLKGFFDQVKTGAASILTPMRLATAGAAGIGAAALYLAYNWQDARSKVEQSLIGIGQRTGTTAADINRFAEANASATGLSISQARDAAIEFTKTGNITVSSLKGVGDAIHGYSILTGKDATTATKEFAGLLGGDLVEAAKKLDQTYGFLDAGLLDYLRSLDQFKDRSKGVQAILDAIASDNKKAEDSVGGLTRAWTAFGNFLSNFKNGASSAPDLKESLAAAQAARDEAAANQPTPLGNGIGRNSRGELVSDTAMFGLDELKKNAQAAQDALDNVNAENAAKELKKLSTAADGVVHAVLPQIDSLKQLNDAIKLIQTTQDGNGTGINVSPSKSNEALTVLKYQRDLTQESLDMTVRQAQAVTNLRAAWGGVSASTALALNQLQGQLGVAQAVTGQEQMRAQYVATVNDLLAQGKSEYEAQAIASAQMQIAQAAATANVERQVEALRDSTDMIRAQANGTEAATAAAIAYKNAIKEGASATAAAALSAETMANAVAKAAAAQAQADAANERAVGEQYGAIYNSSGALVGIKNAWGSDWNDGKQYTSGYDPGGFVNGPLSVYNNIGPTAQGINNTTNQAYQNGGIDAAITALKGIRAFGGIPLSGGGMYADAPAVPLDYNALFSQADTLYALKNNQTSDKGTQVSNLQAELSWVQGLPETLARDQKIVDLKKSIQDLQSSVDANTDALTQVTLNPLYTEGHSAMPQIGYFHAAAGLDMVARGPTSGDQIPFHAMINGNERVQIKTVEQQRAEAANSNRPASAPSVTIYNDLRGVSDSKARRSRRHVAQGFDAALRASA